MKKNVEPRLKIHLLEGKSITHNEAQAIFGTNRLAEYIRRLRRKGMDIEMELIKTAEDVYGRYFIKQDKKQNRITSRSYLGQCELKR
jgi:hypothetical protein